MWGEVTPPVVQVTRDGSFLSKWDEDAEGGPPCEFYNASFQYTGALCSHFALARMGQQIQTEAFQRALSCAAYYQTDCILSPEIGLAVPAAFVYDENNGLKMLIAPKILELPVDRAMATKNRLIEFRDPRETRYAQIEMQDTVNAEYVLGGTRSIETVIFSESSAYCIQLLRLAFDASCWGEID